eukprot:CAMPEP_0170401948 /NCGR_PEP_ID=MMETSP0117_2-20130122/25295_1 /TAXON_ID=400756 /ORGANISM="Durinskia baltica, Strain CSIRO CS-38" /LENGTH=80 /DNA_ID=CAMNT_0010658781 /DNA_START=8 /DNA_END=247 /DNA_ORIENTATION=+
MTSLVEVVHSSGQRRLPRPRSANSSDVFAVEDAQRLLQRLDFFLPAGDAILVADAGIDARGLQLVEVCERRVQLFLGAFK